MLRQLIRSEIDGQRVQERLISAMLLGTNLAVPKGKDVGGAFQHVPLCHAASQTGCVIAYASFRANVPPPAKAKPATTTGSSVTGLLSASRNMSSRC